MDKLGQTALMYAAARGNRLAVCWLVAKGADASIKSKSGKTAGDLSHGDLSDFLTALEKEKQPLSRQEARDMYAYQGEVPGEIEIEEDFFSSEDYLEEADEILLLRGAKAEEFSKLKNMEWKMDSFSGSPMELALLYRIGARKFILPGDLSSVANVQPLQLLRALGVKVDIDDPVLQMKIALQLKQKETALEQLKKDPPLLQNPEIFSSISDAKTLQALLNTGLDAKNEKLVEAVIEKGDGAMLKALLKAGATLQDPNKTLEEYSNKGANFVLTLIDAGAKADVNTSLFLHQAASRVNLPDVQQLLAHGANPNAKGNDQMTPLMAAANSATREAEKAAHRTEIVKRLLDAGADIHAKDSAGKGVIYYTACGGCGDVYRENSTFYRVSKRAEADILSMVELLIKAGADVPKDILTQELRPEISPAGREKLALMLLDAGADPLAKREDGWTSLMANGVWGSKIAKRLLDAGVDPCVKLEKTSWRISTDRWVSEEPSAMNRAMAEGAVEVVKLLKEKGIDPGELWVVDPEKIEPLLKIGARISKDMTYRLMSDFTNVRYGGKAPARLCADYVDIIQILKQHGYKPELASWGKDRESPLFEKFNMAVLRAFFKAGEDPNETDGDGNSLLANIVQAEVPDKICDSSIMLFSESMRRIDQVMPDFIEAGVDVNKPINQDGQTPLFYAGNAKLIAQLLRAGADARVRDAKGRTPLFFCSFYGDGSEMVRLLMQRGIRINTQDNEGNTALMMAVMMGETTGVQALLDSGANPNIKNKAGKTALQIAREEIDHEYNRNEIVKLLKEHGAKE